ncbi:PLP-dependent aspartate aminotransferase family protein [Microbulbifer taiwanensis]|uniref:PLP-dependent aspartate aminotransferase family protein n=1 Tax=Microbulbifer taiwanensis TaxID=986746 RepID=A0ABW1YNU8_9GAMM|nr:PLP-dependent aspartate aminotransferase family protein [Microbulbifer taiwanensis]
MSKGFGVDTLLVVDDSQFRDAEGAVVPPIYQNSLFTFDSWEAIDSAFDDKVNRAIYTRGNNPSVALVEKKLALLAGAEKARLFSSGMAAISAAILHFVSAGDHVIAVKNAYGPTVGLLNDFLGPKLGIECSFVGGGEIEEFTGAIRPNTRLIFLESPSSVVFGLQDLAAVADLARSRGIATAIDNTWATPYFQKPLALGIDLEIHSCSKYLGGHSDLVAGALIGSVQLIDEIRMREYELLGAKMAPIEAWLLLRSLRTLPLRMERHQQSALRVAQFLRAHPSVRRVFYPGLEDFPQYDLARRQMSGFSGLMGFELATDELDSIKRFFNALELFRIGVSWGGHESLVYAPAIGYLREQSPDRLADMGIFLGNMRISVGLESADDLIADLDRALCLVL